MHLSGRPVAVIAAWIGHKDASLMLRLYAHRQADAADGCRGDFEPSCVTAVSLSLDSNLRTAFALVRASR
jgi:hypothetical protein